MENQSNDQFSLFVETCEKIRSTTKKNEKIDIISNYITNLDETSLSIAVLFLSGRALAYRLNKDTQYRIHYYYGISF